MTHGSLFSGIGGFDLAADRLGWENIFHCEINQFCQKILKYYWPQANSYEDIKTTDFTVYRGRIDVLSGGFPCQPFSTAGQRKGSEDDRYLWPEMLRAIDEIRPTWVVGENVSGLVSMVQPEVIKTYVESQTNFFGEVDQEVISEYQQYVIETVCSDLERIGYSVQPVIIPACAVGAPHRRDRVWFIANANHSDDGGRPEEDEIKGRGERIQERDKIREFSQSSNFRDRHSSDAEIKGLQHIGFPKRNDSSGRQVENGLPVKSPRDDWRTLPTENWENFPTQSPVCSGDDGVPKRLDGITFPKWRIDSIKGYGNAVVPQVVMEIYRGIEQLTNQIKS